MKKVIIQVKPYSNKELAALYGVSTRTFRRWTALFSYCLGDRIGHYYSVLQVEIIFNKLGVPYFLED